MLISSLQQKPQKIKKLLSNQLISTREIRMTILIQGNYYTLRIRLKNSKRRKAVV